MDLEDLLLPQELKLDDKDVIWNVDFCRLAGDLFMPAYMSWKKHHDYLEHGKDASILRKNLQYVLQTNVLMNKIDGCFSNMDDAILYIRKFYDRAFFDKYSISYVDFVEYHTDMFNYKLCTIKDLSHKLILLVYGKDISIYNWKVTQSCLNEHGNHDMLSLYEEAMPLFSFIMNKRHSASHDGKSDISELYDLGFVENMRLYSKNNPNLNQNDVERESINLRLTKGHEHIANLVSLRNNVLRFLCRYYHYLYQHFYNTIMEQEEPVFGENSHQNHNSTY